MHFCILTKMKKSCHSMNLKQLMSSTSSKFTIMTVSDLAHL